MSYVETATSSGLVPDSRNQSIPELIKQVSEESSRLLRGELRLAQAEMTQKAKTAGVGIGAFGAAAVLAGSHWAASWPPPSWRWPSCCQPGWPR
jgi:Putative Actinobacterial Holin-X, holin superfamily III